MQGSNSIATVKRFLKSKKPPIMMIQEARVTALNIAKFRNIPNYKMFLHNVDTLTYIREDVQVTKTTQDDKISFSHGLINIKHQGKNLWIMNVYIRDKELKPAELIYIDKTYQHILIMGDTNAKHLELLPHTQKTAHNSNGVVLKNFLEGTYAGPGQGNPLAWKLHNSYTESEFIIITGAR